MQDCMNENYYRKDELKSKFINNGYLIKCQVNILKNIVQKNK